METQEDVDKKIERVEMLERRAIVTENKTLGSEDTFERLEIMKQRVERWTLSSKSWLRWKS